MAPDTTPAARDRGDADYTATDECAILDVISRWLKREVAPRVMQMEHDDVYPHELVEQMKEFGLFGATVSQRYGGLGLRASTYARIVALISEQWMSLTGIFNSHLMMAAIVEKHGTEEQREYWLPRFVTGEIRGGLALTEPDAGTDLQGIRTRATADGDSYRIDGTKTWISNGIEGAAVALLVKTDPDATPPRRGMSMFIAPKVDPDTGRRHPGFRTGRRLEKLGYHGIDSAELIFEDYLLDARRHLVGGEPGRGFYMAVGGLELGRINVAARSVGIARRALDEATAYAQTRKTFGKPIAEHQAIQLKLGEMATRTRAAELLTEDAARAYDAGERCDMEAGMAKYFASESAVANAMEAMRVHGGYGYSREYPVERLYREAPLMCIGEGTNEMQRIVIARQLIERNPV
ncbi:MAG: acyl-CoA dehydrogenase [Gammaproteobacteria bacterium]|nr:acyl-CoA dehydrogenase [Gammaproteobacteria bacterium]